MQNGTLSNRTIQFVEHVLATRGGRVEDLRVLDVRLECRSQRLMEYGDWSLADLELIEQEATGYGDDAKLSELLSGEACTRSIDPATWWLDSPSPFAWT
jgi:hypothetical protein